MQKKVDVETDIESWLLVWSGFRVNLCDIALYNLITKVLELLFHSFRATIRAIVPIQMTTNGFGTSSNWLTESWSRFGGFAVTSSILYAWNGVNYARRAYNLTAMWFTFKILMKQHFKHFPYPKWKLLKKLDY